MTQQRNLTAHMSDIHQNQRYLDHIAGIHPDTRLLVIHGDMLQCHKNKRPSKGRIKGLPGVDNGFGETVQKWVLEAPAYINHGTPVPKGEKVDFNTIPKGMLKTDTENYAVMHQFMQEVVRDTKLRMEEIAEATYQRFRETGMRTFFFPGHDNAYNLWLGLLFDDIKTLNDVYSEIITQPEGLMSTSGSPTMHALKDGETKTVKWVHDELEGMDIAEIFMPLTPLESTVSMLKEYIGQERNLSYEEVIRHCGAIGGDFHPIEKHERFRKLVGYAAIKKVPIICVNSHEGPREVSDLVLGEGEGKPTEERKLFEDAFSALARIIPYCPGKVLWLYGNDGEPKAVTKDMSYAGCPVRVHHLAELDEKGNPESMKGDITYVDQKTGELLLKDRKSGQLVPHQVME